MKVKLTDNNLIKPIKSSRVCPVCGELNKRLYGFCVYCNERLDGKVMRNYDSPAPAYGKGRLLISISLFLIIILVLYIMARRGGF